MMRFRQFIQAALCAAAIQGPGVAIASDEGQWIVNQIDQTMYRHYLDDVLYTHDGNSRLNGSADHAAARTAIVDTCLGFGLDVQLHDFTWNGRHGSNIIATQMGQVDPNLCFVIGAHYDSANCPGADDDASGVAALLELARVSSKYPFEFTILYIAFDLEEFGLEGSEAYVNEHDTSNILGMIQLDMIAFNNNRNEAEIYSRTTYRPHKLRLKAAFDAYVQEVTPLLRSQFDASDHVPFELAGVPACLLIEPDPISNPCLHTACDSVDTLNYIDYAYATSMTRAVAGFLADNALALVCPGDLNHDGSVNIADLGLVLAHFGEVGPMSPGDADADGDADIADLGLVMSRFGSACE